MGVEVDPPWSEGEIGKMENFLPDLGIQGSADLSDDFTIHPQVTRAMNLPGGFDQGTGANEHGALGAGGTQPLQRFKFRGKSAADIGRHAIDKKNTHEMIHFMLEGTGQKAARGESEAVTFQILIVHLDAEAAADGAV